MSSLYVFLEIRKSQNKKEKEISLQAQFQQKDK